MSPLRIATLLIASVLTALSTTALTDTANGGGQGLSYPLVLALTCSSLTAWISFVAVTVRDKLATQITGIKDLIGEYGDQREADGYLAGVRDTNASGHLTRVK